MLQRMTTHIYELRTWTQAHLPCHSYSELCNLISFVKLALRLYSYRSQLRIYNSKVYGERLNEAAKWLT